MKFEGRLTVAQNLLREGTAIAAIARMTGLAIAQIESLSAALSEYP